MDGRADRFPAMKNERKGRQISGNKERAEGKTGFQQSKVKRLDWDGDFTGDAIQAISGV